MINYAGELRNIAANKCVDVQFKDAEKKFGLRKCMSDDPLIKGEQVSNTFFVAKLLFFFLIRFKVLEIC